MSFTNYVTDFLMENRKNENVMLSIVRDVNSYTGSLEDLVWEDMSEFDSFCSGMNPLEIARKCFYGEFKPCNKYFKFDNAGNICSTDFVKYDKYDIEEIVDAIKEMTYSELPDCIKDIYNECIE